jgi:hypothetical protein
VPRRYRRPGPYLVVEDAVDDRRSGRSERAKLAGVACATAPVGVRRSAVSTAPASRAKGARILGVGAEAGATISLKTVAGAFWFQAGQATVTLSDASRP